MREAKIFIIIAVLVGIIIFTVPPVFNLVDDARWMFASFTNPHLNHQQEELFAAFTNEQLLRGLRSIRERTRGYASSELVKRKDRSLIPVFIKMLNSSRKNEKWTALYALAEMKEMSVIKLLLKEVHSKDLDERMAAVKKLAELQYEPIIPEIRKIAEIKLPHSEIPQDNAIEMCKCFGNNPETLEILAIIAKSEPIKGYEWISAAKIAREAIKEITGKDYQE